MNIIVTEHAEQRAKERLRWNKNAIERMAEKAYIEGISHSDADGKLKKYFDKLFLIQHQANNTRIYGQVVYLFSDNRLVTLFLIPKNVEKHIKNNNMFHVKQQGADYERN
jgi:predicted metallo-beta-lactamase superfamily hydrolase